MEATITSKARFKPSANPKAAGSFRTAATEGPIVVSRSRFFKQVVRRMSE
jgi:hypothetical protein